MENGIRLNERGYAIIAAIESGLLTKTENGWDDTAFNRFWEKYVDGLAKRNPEAKRLLKL